MLERCPTCGKTVGTLMETHPDRPGLIDSLRGEGGELRRIFVTVAVCVLFVLLLTATQAVFA